MQHRAWMLRSLVAHINTDNVKTFAFILFFKKTKRHDSLSRRS